MDADMDDDAPLAVGAVPPWVAEAFAVISEHRIERWTGCCSACGRPSPCAGATDAMDLLRRFRAMQAVQT